MNRLRRNHKAVSPVISTIIIVSVAIVMSIAVAYWMLGLSGTFTRYEKIEFQAAYAISNPSDGGWNVTLTIKNTGSSPATLTNLLINGVPYNSTKGVYVYWPTSRSVVPGKTETIRVRISPNADLLTCNATSGITIELMLQTAAGYQYPKTIVLP